MYLKHQISLYLSCVLMAICMCSKAAEPTLNGLAIHSELGKEQFIGALYSSIPGSDATTMANAPSLRMELKIVSPEGMTTRRFSRTWIEGMAINNTQAQLTDQADFMVKFDSMFKGRLMQNDHITFSYAQTKGVNIFVN